MENDLKEIKPEAQNHQSGCVQGYDCFSAVVYGFRVKSFIMVCIITNMNQQGSAANNVVGFSRRALTY